MGFLFSAQKLAAILGRTAQPAKLLLLSGRKEGQDSAGRPVPAPPLFKRLAPKPPTWLSREAAAEWRRIVPGLTRLDLVKPEDRATLTAYCETWATFVEATRTVQREGITVENPQSGRVAVHPAVMVKDKAATQLRHYAAHFGLTPAAERSVSKRDDDRDEHEANPFAGAVGDDD